MFNGSAGYGMYEWREDMKRLLRKAGLEKKPVTFLFADNQVLNQIDSRIRKTKKNNRQPLYIYNKRNNTLLNYKK